MRWEFGIRNFSIHYSISKTREREGVRIILENKSNFFLTRFRRNDVNDIFNKLLRYEISVNRDIKILGWCPAGLVLPHREKVPL